jgi:hypothetical protein
LLATVMLGFLQYSSRLLLIVFLLLEGVLSFCPE